MKKYFLISLIGLLSFCTYSQSVTKPEWPEITQQNKPWSRWWWQGSAVNQKDLTWMMEEYKKAGLGGLEITPIYGVKGYEKQFIDFLSPEWMKMLKHTLKEGERLNLGIDMAQASGWPFGGPWVKDEEASKYVAHKIYKLKTGEALKEPVNYIQEALVRTVGEKIAIEKLVEPIAKNPNLQLHAFDQVRFPNPLPLKALIAYSNEGETIDLTTKVDASGNLNWKAPKGEWTLYALFEGMHGKMVERAGPGGEGYAIDHFSNEATVNYLQKFDEVFKGEDLKSLRAFFNDSYEVDDAQGEADWTPKFLEEFRKRRGYDLRNHLPALFGNDESSKNERVLCDYRETISDLLLENYTKTWSNWAKKHGKIIRNQAHGSPANILDLYAITDIPEIEGEDILRIKFASSAANVTGKPLVSSESATWENEHFLSSLGDIKKDMDRFLLGGVNHTFYHGTNYTPQKEAWPGWLFYAAVHFTPKNPFWADFAKLNNYVARVQSFMQKGNPNNDVLLYLPIYDAFSKPGKSLLQHFDGIDHGFKGSSLEECAKYLQEKGYSFDFISDKQLLNTSANNNQIETGGISYKTILVPEVKYMPLGTARKLGELADQGVSIVFYKNLPSDVQGFNDLKQRREEYKALIAQVSFTSSKIEGVQEATIGGGSLFMSDDLEKALNAAGVKRETFIDSGIEVIRRKHENGYYYFIVNWGEKPINGWVPLQVEAQSVAVFNPMTEKAGYGEIRKTSANTIEVYLQLEKGESLILETNDNNINGSTYPYITTRQPEEIKGTWTITFLKGGPQIPQEIKTTNLKSWTEFEGEEVKNFSGTASYSVSFKKPSGKADAWVLDLGKVEQSASVVLNGKPIATVIGPVYKVEIPSDLFQKKNTLEIKVSSAMANRVAYMDKNNIEWKKFYNINMPSRLPENRGKDGLFTAESWHPKPSGLLGPVTIAPAAFKTKDK